MKPTRVTIQMKTTEPYFHVVLSILQAPVVRMVDDTI